MPAVFVHGNPENSAIWDDLVARLGRTDAIKLSPPGFGAAVPTGFVASVDVYRDWLSDELKRIEGPIDLVGHDLGGLLVLRIAMEQPELIRSWATDVAGAFDPHYVWHDLAQVWQTPGTGEQSVKQIAETPVDIRAKQYESRGMSKVTAAKIAAGFDETMGRCILSLYRSAAQPAMARWGERLQDASGRPGLVLVATEDRLVGGEVLARRSAAKCSANVTLLRGLGHWWMSQDPQRGAGALTGFWSTLDI